MWSSAVASFHLHLPLPFVIPSSSLISLGLQVNPLSLAGQSCPQADPLDTQQYLVSMTAWLPNQFLPTEILVDLMFLHSFHIIN